MTNDPHPRPHSDPFALTQPGPTTSLIASLRQSEQRYRSVVEHLGEGMMVVRDGRIVFVNPQASSIMHVAQEDLLGADPVQWIHPDDRAAVMALRTELRETESPTLQRGEFRIDARHIGSDGVVRWLHIRPVQMEWEGQRATMTFFSDITERKAMVTALHRSEERYRAVIDHVGEAMVVVQGERFVFANPRAAEIVQMTVADMLREGYLHRIHPDDHAIVQERRRRRLAGEAMPNRYEIRLVMPDGQVKWIDIGVTIVPWDGALATLTFFSDVTARKALEAKLQQTLDERETILQSSIVGIAFLTPSGRFRWANHAMRQIFGAVQGAENLTSIESLYPSREQYLETGAAVAASIARGEVFQTELQMRRLDGSTLWASLSGKAVSLGDLTQGTVWVVMDISRRKELEEALQRTSSEREAILNSALVGMVLSVARRHQWVNDKFTTMVGYSREELIGRTSDFLHLSPELWVQQGEQARAALTSTGSYSGERQLRRRSGEVFWVELTGRCIKDRDPSGGVIWTFLDITARRKAEDDTRAALARQRELNDLRSRFVSMTSHEFRTPLATILSSAELLKYYGERLPAEDKAEVFATIESAVQRMTGMLDRVLLLGKADAQMLEFDPQTVDLPRLCTQLMAEAHALQPLSSCQLQQAIDPQLGPGRYDPKLLRHIFGNLLSNAIKYSPNGGLVRFSAERAGEWVVFEVSDQGIGIPADELPHLFESFHRASNVGDIQGTGLGLAIVKNSVDLHQGSIEAHSDAGVGTRFTVRLPLGN